MPRHTTAQIPFSFLPPSTARALGNYVLAVTVNYSQGPSTFTEADVIFHNSRKWNSYRGPQQGAGSSATYDLHRVALHEFGHVLGLDHPDEYGQFGREALMNSIISDLDHITADDIEGVRSLYGPKITSSLSPPSVRSGDAFSFQITANNNPTNFSALGLPPGLQLDSTTGLISGRCPSSGTFFVDVVVQGSLGAATGRLQIVVLPLPLTGSYYLQVPLGDSLSYQITAGNSPTSFSATGLPPGVQINSATGLISGVSQISGNFEVIVKATGANSEASGTIRIIIVPPQITSPSYVNVDIGSSVSYQITASHRPASFTATGLPAGLQLDGTTGMITGVAELSGFYHVQLIAHGAIGAAAGTLIVAVDRLVTSTPPIAQVSMAANGSVCADPARGRIYISEYYGIAVLDAATFAVVHTIPLPTSLRNELSMSADGKTLWVTGYYSNIIRSVDLDAPPSAPRATWRICAEPYLPSPMKARRSSAGTARLCSAPAGIRTRSTSSTLLPGRSSGASSCRTRPGSRTLSPL